MTRLVIIICLSLNPFFSIGQIQDFIAELKDSKKQIPKNPIATLKAKKGWILYAEYCASGDSINYFHPPINTDTQTYFFLNSNEFLIKGRYKKSYTVNGNYHIKNDSIMIRYNNKDIYPSNDTICDYKIVKLNSKRLIVDYTYDYKKIWGDVNWSICPMSRFLFIRKE